MSLQSETKLLEFAKWFNFHKTTITSLDKRCEFLEKACDNLGIVLLHALEDIKILEGRGRIGGNLEVISANNALNKVQARIGGKPLDLTHLKNG